MTARRLSCLLAALVAAAAPRAARAQEPADTTAHPRVQPPGDSVAAIAPGDTTLSDTTAPAPVRPVPRLVVTVQGGLVRFTDLQSQAARLAVRGATGETTSTVLLRTLGVNGGVGGGASALLNLSRRWGARLGVSILQATLNAAYAAGDSASSNRAGRLPAPGERGVRVTVVDAALQYRLPAGARLHPYLELGAAAVSWATDATTATALAGASDLLHAQTRAAVEAAVGAVVPVTDALSVRLQATTQLFRTPLGTAPASALIASGDSASLSFDPPRSAHYADAAVELVRAMRLEVGLSYGFGRLAPERPSESAEVGSSTPTPR